MTIYFFIGVGGAEDWVRVSDVHRGILCILCVVWVRVEAEVQFGSDVFIKEWRRFFEILSEQNVDMYRDRTRDPRDVIRRN